MSTYQVFFAAVYWWRQNEVWKEDGWTHDPQKGWVKPSWMVPIKPLPDWYYKKAQVPASAPEYLIDLICEKYVPPRPSNAAKFVNHPAKLLDLQEIEEACATLADPYKRCMYDHKFKHKDGLWGGYASWVSRWKRASHGSRVFSGLSWLGCH